MTAMVAQYRIQDGERELQWRVRLTRYEVGSMAGEMYLPGGQGPLVTGGRDVVKRTDWMRQGEAEPVVLPLPPTSIVQDFLPVVFAEPRETRIVCGEEAWLVMWPRPGDAVFYSPQFDMAVWWRSGDVEG